MRESNEEDFLLLRVFSLQFECDILSIYDCAVGNLFGWDTEENLVILGSDEPSILERIFSVVDTFEAAWLSLHFDAYVDIFGYFRDDLNFCIVKKLFWN